jgi:hypothetical protein
MVCHNLLVGLTVLLDMVAGQNGLLHIQMMVILVESLSINQDLNLEYF